MEALIDLADRQHRRGRSRFSPIGGFLLILAGFQLGPSSQLYAADTITVGPEQARLVGIETAPLGEHAGPASLRFPARVVVPPHQMRMVGAPVPGLVVRIDGEIDQPVRSGQVLAEIASAEVPRAQAEFLQAVQREQLLRGTLAREQKLAPDQLLPQKQILATRNEHTQAQAATAERRQMLRLMGMADPEIDALAASRALRASVIVAAPIDATVLEISVVPGQKVEAMTPLYKLARLSPLWLELQVPLAQAARFAEGDAVGVAGSSVTARVVSIASSADPATQSVTVRAETAADMPTGLRPGQFVEARVTLRANGERRWNVRPEAVVRRSQEAFLFVQTGEGFRAEPVTVHDETPELTVVSGPFRGDERIAVRGLIALKGAWQGLGGQATD